MRSQFVYHVKLEIVKLYDLAQDSTAIARLVDHELEMDRFMYAQTGYEGHLCSLRNTTGSVATNLTELNASNDKSISRATDPRCKMGKVLPGEENGWESRFRIS